MKNENITLTEQEMRCLDDLDNFPKGKIFGQLQCKQYVGKNQELQFLNLEKEEEGKKYIGTIFADATSDVWWFKTNTGEVWRIPEPADGIEELFELEFKRVKEN